MTDRAREDEHWMSRCLQLASRGAGRVSPNPMVGAVIVGEDGAVLGEGWHECFGEPHAERNAIADAVTRGTGERLRQATLYVNLEPCNHHGKTPPCTDIILEMQIPNVVVGAVDENPRVNGAGIERLREHGVDVRVGVLVNECRRLNEAFFHHLRTGRPLISLKIAQTLDGRIATRSGDSRWISGPESRNLVHRWRAELDAVLVGSGTALADDPALTVRHVKGRQPYRVVLDREGRLPATLRLFRDEHTPMTIAVIAAETPDPAYADDVTRAGGAVVRADTRDGHLDLHHILHLLGSGTSAFPPLQSILVEAGPALSTALFRSDLIDRLYIFIAPKIIGSGIPAIADLNISQIKDARVFKEVLWKQHGEDMLLAGFLREV